MTEYVDIFDAYSIHQFIIARAKKTATIRDFALLHSAIERPKATFNGKSLYPTLFSKAASLLQSICLNHAFTDGNKRTAWAVTKRFLWINNYHLQAGSHEGADFMVFVDNSKPDILEISKWLKRHCEKK